MTKPALAAALAILAVSAASSAFAQLLPPPPTAQEKLVEDIVAWVNDDVILWSELSEGEQQNLAARLANQPRPSTDELARVSKQVRDETLLQMIWNRLLVQEAERLYDIKSIRKDLVDSFMERQQVKSEEELTNLLAQYAMTREELEERLILSRVPDYVVDSQVMKTMGISEEDARQWYGENLDRFRTAAEVTFREIVLEAASAEERQSRRPDAEKVVLLAKAGGDFEKLVAEFSETPSKALGGKIGPINPGDLRPEIARATLNVAVGGISDPIETNLGWHVIKVESRRDVTTPPFEQVREEVEGEIRRERFGPAYDEFVSKLWKGSVIEVREEYADRVPSPWRDRIATR